MKSKYQYTLIYTEVLTTLLVLWGTSNNATMGDPTEGVPMFRFNSMGELGRAICRLKDSGQFNIGKWWCH